MTNIISYIAKRGGLCMAVQRLACSTRGRQVFQQEFDKIFGSASNNEGGGRNQEEARCQFSKQNLETFILYLDVRFLIYYVIHFKKNFIYRLITFMGVLKQCPCR